MRKLQLFRLDTPYREPMVIRGFEFGDKGGRRAAAIVGSTRGNEVQQTFICAELVRKLTALESSGALAPQVRVLVVPSANPFSMNIGSRFWPLDKTDINRQFPGSDRGETTERVAAGLFEAVRPYGLGVQLCSFHMPGDFEPHVRVIRVGDISEASLAMAEDFGLPYVVEGRPGPFDTKMLNYNWQLSGTRAFSLYSRATDSLDLVSARVAEEGVLRFLSSRGILRADTPAGVRSSRIDEAQLVDVRTREAGGFLVRKVRAGERVHEGQVMAQVLDAYDTHVREELVAPVAGAVFYCRTSPLVQQDMICFRVTGGRIPVTPLPGR